MHIRRLRGWLMRLFGLFDRGRREREFAEELESHLALHIEDNLRAGMSPEEARRRAFIKLGGVTQTTELHREQRGLPMLETLLQDLRFGARMLRKNPGFSFIAILTLALGIGANTAIFSLVNAVLLRPLPYASPEQLLMLRERLAGRDLPVSYLNFTDWREQNSVFESLAAVRQRESFNFIGAGEPERLQGRLVSANFLATLGVRPFVGRDFLAADDRSGAGATVILSYAFWQRRFGAAASVIGQSITLNQASFTVIGVTPPDFQFGAEADVTVPLGLSAARFRLRGKDPGLLAVARLKSNVSLAQAEAEMQTITTRLAQQYPDSNAGRSVRMEALRESLIGNARLPLLLLFGAVGLVLLIACANVANLLLVRATARGKELAIRAALGASRRRLMRQLLTESLLLAAAGGAAGLLLAFWGTSFIVAQLQPLLATGIPRLREAGVDLPALGFTLAASLLTGVLCGLAPALQFPQQSLSGALKENERGTSGHRSRLRSGLVVAEVALTLTLLLGAGLLIRSFQRLLQVDPGYDARGLLTMLLPVNVGAAEGSKLATFFDELQQRVQSLPGVTATAVSNGLPIAGANQPPFFIEGRRPEAGREPGGVMYIVSPAYFQTLGIQLLKGRGFSEQDTRESRLVAVIDEALARQHFQDQDPIGQRLALAVPGTSSYEIVGVVRHVEHFSLDGQAPVAAQFYLNFNQIPLPMLTQTVIFLLVRGAGDPLSLAAPVRRQIAALNPTQTVFNLQTMEQVVAQSIVRQRFSMLLLGVFAGVALLLASVGLYGLMSQTVTARQRELGIRLALGAQSRDVLRLVIGQGMKLVLLGAGLGLLGALVLTRQLKTLLFGVSATDLGTFALVTLLLLLVALLACWIPARRATRVDPLIALRCE